MAVARDYNGVCGGATGPRCQVGEVTVKVEEFWQLCAEFPPKYFVFLCILSCLHVAVLATAYVWTGAWPDCPPPWIRQ